MKIFKRNHAAALAALLAGAALVPAAEAATALPQPVQEKLR